MQKFAHRLLGVLSGLCLCVSAGATTTVTGTLKTLGTGNITSGAFVRFYLRGCAGNQPRVNGTALIGPTVGAVFYFDIAADSSGNISGTLYSTRDAAGTGNGDIECGGSKTGVWYGMQAFQGGRGGPEVPIHAKSGVSLDITSVTPISTNPVVTAPTGDTPYLRLDNGNNGTSGTTFTRTADKLSVFAATTSAELAGVLSDETGSGGGFMRATGPTTSSPIINGTPTGTGIATYTAKSGTGAGSYTTASASFVDADLTNLAYTVTVPTGWKLIATATGVCGQSTAATGIFIGIYDSVANDTKSNLNPVPASINANLPFSTQRVINGDGASHTVSLRYATGNVSNSAVIVNATSGGTPIIPQMVFVLSPSN